MKSSKILILVSIFFLCFSCSEREKTCLLEGELIGRPESKNIILIKGLESPNGHPNVVIIPIVNQKFSHAFSFHDQESYQLIFEEEYYNGTWRPILFSPNDGLVQMQLNTSEEALENTITGGKLNRLYTEYSKLIDTIASQKDRNQALYQWSTQNINEVSYYYFIKHLFRYRDYKQKHTEDKVEAIFDPKKIHTLAETFSKAYPNHPYTFHANTIFWNIENIRIGGRYFDFIRKDIHGKPHQFSDKIKGKVALLHIWAPWCDGSLMSNHNLLDIYKTYKDKGFTIIGLANKYKDTNSLRELLKEEQYPWLNLIDENVGLSDINKHYGTERLSGIRLLIDKEGEIVAINPSIEILEAYLEENNK